MVFATDRSLQIPLLAEVGTYQYTMGAYLAPCPLYRQGTARLSTRTRKTGQAPRRLGFRTVTIYWFTLTAGSLGTRIKGMSFLEILAEIPRLTPEQQREVMRLLREVEAGPNESSATREFCLRRDDKGRATLTAPRVIRQAEVNAILEEFP